jgi:hypothetical protein
MTVAATSAAAYREHRGSGKLGRQSRAIVAVSYTHLRAHETG